MQKSAHDKFRPYAKRIKIYLQMLIGIALTCVLIGKILEHLGINIAWLNWIKVGLYAQSLFKTPTLSIVGHALSYSAAIDLAYTLFTPGPDEAVEPLITGLAAAILLEIANPDKLIPHAVSIAIFVTVLAGLFVIRRVFIEERRLWERSMIFTPREKAEERPNTSKKY
jgi:hypothetical protein